jgi:molybdopterin converting factor small subunit
MSVARTVTVRFPALLAERIGGADAVTVEGETVGAALADLARRHPALAPLLWREDARGEARPNPMLALFVNGRQVPLDRLATALVPGDELMVVTAIEGG